MSVTILVTYIMTRAYGRAGYGDFNLMQAFPGLFFMLADFGLNAIATRELSKETADKQKIFSNILSLRLLITLFLIIFAFIVLFFMPYSGDLLFGLRLSLLLILTFSLVNTTNIVFQVNLRYEYSAISNIFGYFIILGLVLFTTHFNYPVSVVNATYVLGGFITFLTNVWFIRRLGLLVKPSLDPELAKWFFIQSLPIGLMFVFSQINFRADAILLSVLPLPKSFGLSASETVAIYGLPYKIFEVALVLPTFFMNAVYPIYVKHLEESKEKFLQTFQLSFVALLAMGACVSFFGFLLSPFMINFLGGAEFTESILVLRILLGGIVLFYITQPFSWFLVTLGKQKLLPWVYFGVAAFNLMANLIYIPHLSYLAASTITWISELIIAFLLILLSYMAWKDYAKS